MTEPRILADRLVERTFNKKRARKSPVEKEPSPPHSVIALIEEARKVRKQREQLVSKFKEF